tara:strand:- start:542 stop:1852 length:1311 start_codon:yes stop_codon:yes gene_type:complete
MFIGLNVLRIKLPLLLLPIIIGSSSYLSKKEHKTIIITFFVGLLISTIWVYLVSVDLLTTKKNSGTVRDASVFMSHIRYSILLSFSTMLLIYLSIKANLNKVLSSVLLIWLVFILFKLATLTAICGLFIAILCCLPFLLKNKKNTFNKQLLTVIVIFIISAVAYLSYTIKDFYHVKNEKRSSKKESIKGEKYLYDFNDHTTENGYYLWENIAACEMEEEWNKRSKINFKALDQKGQMLKATIYRFLTSKGLDKDSAGLSQLSNKEIALIESGETSFIHYNNLEKRIRSFLYERENLKKSKDPNNQTTNQRIEFWKVGMSILAENLVFGYGPGGVKKEYKKYYKKSPTLLLPKNQLLAHNQFITQAINLGILGFLMWTAILLYSFLRIKKEIKMLFVSYAVLMSFAFISDDMLEVQAGATIFSLFGTMILFYKPQPS